MNLNEATNEWPYRVLIIDDPAETATILAALRFYREQGMGEPANRSDYIHALATAFDGQISLSGDGIDVLCERILPMKTRPL